MVTPVYGGDTLIPSFGKGQITVRLYTDYFCPPCREMEPKLEPVIVNLINQGFINIIFIDTPNSPHTILYARYFLYALNANNDFYHTLLARNALFAAAENMIMEKEKLEVFLKNRGVKFKTGDVFAALNFWNRYLKEDNITSTPTCVISRGEKKEIFMGSVDIIKALESLK